MCMQRVLVRKKCSQKCTNFFFLMKINTLLFNYFYQGVLYISANPLLSFPELKNTSHYATNSQPT